MKSHILTVLIGFITAICGLVTNKGEIGIWWGIGIGIMMGSMLISIINYFINKEDSGK